ncbi:hypothetical protein [Staphylococcus hominis]|uniref:hypothetical protein n=1 Tax=Staphylococcus hominis TaxID=1290 RepID=UPI001642613F|nr:hypothetical protein [Staphylococcus hominis]MBC2908740.1 hypothetical protein [Staphylococcus hominis]MBC2911174.1 hypothetical protein [Staphylococcus hominis]MBC2913055.1 hypothetical protein [Staphylococcus hominis]MBC2935808.1 hypothetical protein [Staphylococcus hominis]MBC2949978.1 hypothetical protein [Staphylococcus hominis]
MVKIKKKVALEPKAFLVHLLKKEETEVELDGYTFDYNEEHYSFDPEIKTNEFISYSLHSDTFTVEIEEEITEETKLPKCLEIYFDDKVAKADEINVYMEKSISEILQESKRYQFETKAIYLFGDNGNLTPIWKDGELVGDE